MSVHAAANEASLRHLAARLHRAELDLAVAVGNLAYKDAVIADLEAEVDQLRARTPRRRHLLRLLARQPV